MNTKRKVFLIKIIVVMFCFSAIACHTDEGIDCEGCDHQQDDKELPDIVIADFEQMAPSFYASSDDMNYQIVENPNVGWSNNSAQCGKLKTTGDKWELLYSEPLPGTFNFDEGVEFTMKVYSAVPGKVFLKIENSENWQQGQLEVQKEITEANKWTELTFDFGNFKPESNTYGKIIILFDAGETNAGIEWFFDDIRGPVLDKNVSLLQRYENNPVLRPVSDTWYGVHIANAAILTPDESPDGNWRLYARGSGYVPEYHDQIGLFTQSAEDFSPYGPWKEYSNNPVLPYGPAGTYDDKHLLDCAPVAGPNGDFYFYYNAKTFSRNTGALAGAKSTDGGLTFTKFDDVLKPAVGSSDAVYHDGNYYIFYGDGNWDGSKFAGPLQLYVMKTEDPDQFNEDAVQLAIPVGGGPDNFDEESVNGSRIFRLEGVDKWFMVYQGSSRHFDFPIRFHVAYSDDLINWTKVQNEKPFFTRGEPGQWDQGGIWFGETFEHNETLYMYYEGWGCDCVVKDRNKPYFPPGISQTGVAEVPVNEFLEWCGL